MKKVLQVLGSLQRGGAETMVMNVYRRIDKDRLQFDFLVKEHVDDGYEQEVKKLGGQIICVDSPKKQGLLKYLYHVKKAISENGPYCAVHSHMNVISGLIMVASYFAGVKNRISHSHSTQFPNSKIVNWFGKVLITIFSNNKVACGEMAGKALFGKHSFTIVHNGIDVDKFILCSDEKKRFYRRKLGMSFDSIHICHIGRFVSVKNHRFILQIAKELKRKDNRFTIHLLGEGDDYLECESIAKNQNLDNLVFHGVVDNTDEFLKASDLFILPSQYEGVPLTLVEAQCAGIKCIVSDKVPKEVDFGIGLIQYLELNLFEWIDAIRKTNIETSITTEMIRKAAKEKGLDINDSYKNMVGLY